MADPTPAEKDQAAKKAETPRYERDDLLEHAVAWFEEDPVVVSAALTLSDRKTHTQEQVKDLIRKVKKHEVDPDDGTPQKEARLAAEAEAAETEEGS